MVANIFKPIPEVIDQFTGISRKVLDWAMVQKGLMDASRQPGFDPDRWDVLSKFVDEERFRRIGTVKEEMRFADFLGPFLHQSADVDRRRALCLGVRASRA